MAALAVDMRARMFGDRVVAGQENGTTGREVVKDQGNVASRQGRERPSVTREDVVITTGMAGRQGVQDAEQVGDGAPAQSQDCGQGQEDEAAMNRPRERRFQGIEESAHRPGKTVVPPFEASPRLTRLLPSHGAESFTKLLLREPRPGRSVTVDMAASLCAPRVPEHTPHCTKEVRHLRT